MATIKSAVPDSTATLKLLKPPSGVVTTATITGRGVSVAIDVHTADLHAALGIDELGCGCDEADENIKEALAERDGWKNRAVHAESVIGNYMARAEEAEATIARVREVHASFQKLGGLVYRQAAMELGNALDPKPAFVLPTEAGVRFTAKRVGNLTHTSEFVTITDGAGTAFYYIPDDPDGYTKESDRIWPGDRVMREWAGHRLIKPQP